MSWEVWLRVAAQWRGCFTCKPSAHHPLHACPPMQWDGVFELSTQQEAKMCAELRRVRKGGPPAPVALGGQTYEVARFVGAGTYATVHQVGQWMAGVGTA